MMPTEVNRDVAPPPHTREVLVDAVVHGLPHQVVQGGPVVHIADVHAGPLADRLEALEHGDVRRIVVAGRRSSFGRR
jgi:hypothetical protein